MTWLAVVFVYSSAYYRGGFRCLRPYLKPACESNFAFFNELIFGDTGAEPFVVVGLLAVAFVASYFLIGKEVRKAVIARVNG